MLTGSDSMSQDDSNWMRSLGYFGAIVGDIAGCSGIGIAIGYLAWKKLGLPWWVIMLTSMGGLAFAFYRIYRMTMRDFDNDTKK
jgi:hypothetical protein